MWGLIWVGCLKPFLGANTPLLGEVFGVSGGGFEPQMNEKILKYWADRLEERDEVFSGDIEEIDQYRIELILFVLRAMMKNIKIENISNLLDFGCGHARFLPYIEKIIPCKLVNYVGVDIVKKIIEQKKELFKDSKHTNFYTIEDDVIFQGTKFDNWFDSIFSITVLQHIMDEGILKNYIQQFWKLLKPGGFVFIVENIYSAFRNSEEKEKGEYYIIYRGCDSYKHLFKQNGFKFVDANVVSLIPQKELHFFAIFKKVGIQEGEKKE